MQRTRYLIGLLTLVLAIAGATVLWGMLGSGEERPGLHLKIEFRDARGLRPGADVRYRGVTVGVVRGVQIADDGGKAIADLLIDPAAAHQARVSSTFWIVSPRFSGLTSGATGLDTLVRDAYVAFVTPSEGSELLPGSQLAGSEKPPAALEPDALDPLQHGDLLMSVLVPENHGLKPGSPVVFRGMTTGDVRSVELSEDGSYVEVRLRIAHRFRQTVTDRCEFWVARPYVSGALFSGFTVSDVNALVLPFVSYYGKPGEGVPVEDGFRVAASAARPDLQVAEVPGAALTRPPRTAASTSALVLVRIVYAAVEEDALSANDPVHHEGTGVLYLDGSGRAAVLTARSVVDGNYTEEDTFGGDPDIAQEQIKVLLPGGPVLRAHRIWVAADGHDLAVVVVEGAPPDLAVTPANLLDFAAPPAGALQLRAVREDVSPLSPVAVELPGNAPALPVHRGAAIVAGERVVAIYGQSAPRSDTPASAALELLPADLRPR